MTEQSAVSRQLDLEGIGPFGPPHSGAVERRDGRGLVPSRVPMTPAIGGLGFDRSGPVREEFMTG
jgi:hypothetical protein